MSNYKSRSLHKFLSQIQGGNLKIKNIIEIRKKNRFHSAIRWGKPIAELKAFDASLVEAKGKRIDYRG